VTAMMPPPWDEQARAAKAAWIVAAGLLLWVVLMLAR